MLASEVEQAETSIVVAIATATPTGKKSRGRPSKLLRVLSRKSVLQRQRRTARKLDKVADDLQEKKDAVEKVPSVNFSRCFVLEGRFFFFDEQITNIVGNRMVHALQAFAIFLFSLIV